MSKMKKGWVWHEVLTTNVGNASEYYRSLLGWSGETMDMGDTKYLLFKLGEKMVGGMMAAPEGVPTHWLGYVLVDNVDQATTKIKELGGKIVMDPFDIPNIGRACIATDPEGAVFAPFTGTEEKPADEGMPPECTVCWVEHMATDDNAITEFYTKLLGWTAEPMGTSTVLKDGDTMVCSIRKKEGPATAAPSHWLTYIAVPDVDKYIEKSNNLGGRTIMGKTTVPNMGEFAVISDPTGGSFAFWKQTSDLIGKE